MEYGGRSSSLSSPGPHMSVHSSIMLISARDFPGKELAGIPGDMHAKIVVHVESPVHVESLKRVESPSCRKSSLLNILLGNRLRQIGKCERVGMLKGEGSRSSGQIALPDTPRPGFLLDF